MPNGPKIQANCIGAGGDTCPASTITTIDGLCESGWQLTPKGPLCRLCVTQEAPIACFFCGGDGTKHGIPEVTTAWAAINTDSRTALCMPCGQRVASQFSVPSKESKLRKGEIRPGVTDFLARGDQIHPDARGPSKEGPVQHWNFGSRLWEDCHFPNCVMDPGEGDIMKNPAASVSAVCTWCSTGRRHHTAECPVVTQGLDTSQLPQEGSTGNS